MKILVTGSTGLVGSVLVPLLQDEGHEIVRLVRQEPSGREDIRWDPQAGSIDRDALAGAGIEAAVHLAGENIAAGRWTAAQKRRIRDSRVEGTRLLSETLAGLESPPNVLVCASAIGYYGDRGDEELTEESPSGDGFLAEVCREWEAAADPARAQDLRVVHVRTGVVLSTQGGALPKMLTPFKLGLGGIVGSGRQYWSWISVEDVAAIYRYALTNAELSGPVNAVAPTPATNYEFTKALGRVLGRPTVAPLPAFAARLMLGEMADELLLASARVLPTRLQEVGYAFQHPELEGALRHVLGR